jgi:cyclic pyranopterin phosphate synthase
MSPHRIEITAVSEIVERTGVEMEALTACAIASLSLVCSLLEFDPEVSMEELTLWHKSGGRSGDWHRSEPDAALGQEKGALVRAGPTES